MQRAEVTDHIRCSISAARIFREPTFLVWAAEWLTSSGGIAGDWYPPVKMRKQWEALPVDQRLGLGAAQAAVRAAKALRRGFDSYALRQSSISRDWLTYAVDAQMKSKDVPYWSEG